MRPEKAILNELLLNREMHIASQVMPQVRNHSFLSTPNATGAHSTKEEVPI